MIEIKDIPHDILIAVRQRLGAESETDTSRDEAIKHMTPKELMARYAGWQLGDEYWGRHIVQQYEFLKSVYVSEGDAIDLNEVLDELNRKRGASKKNDR